MSTREDIEVAAAQAGYECTHNGTYRQEFTRRAKVNPGKLAQLAEFMGFELREEITTMYSETGGLTGATRRTPRDQAAIDGRYISYSERAEGKNKKGQVLAWLAIELQY